MKTILNNRWITIIGLLVITANIITLALLWARKKPVDPPRREIRGPVFDFLTRELQLDASQQAAYALLRDEHQKGQAVLQDSIRMAKDAFFALLKKPALTNEELLSSSKVAAYADEQLDLYTFKHFQKVRAICTPSQQLKFDSVIQDVLHRMSPAAGGGQPNRRQPEAGLNDSAKGKNRQPDPRDTTRRNHRPQNRPLDNNRPPPNGPPDDRPPPPRDGPPGNRPPGNHPPRPGDRPPPPDDRPPPGDRPPPPDDEISSKN